MFQLKLNDKLTGYDTNTPRLVGIINKLSSWAQDNKVFVLDNYYTAMNLALHLLQHNQWILNTIKQQQKQQQKHYYPVPVKQHPGLQSIRKPRCQHLYNSCHSHKYQNA